MAQCDAQWIPSAHVSIQSEQTFERATQEVAPATRRQVLRRDHHRCRVPGCAHATFVDVHHVETRSEGGSQDASNLLTLCGAHHRAVHEGTLRISGSADSAQERTLRTSGSVDCGLVFSHADGTPYGTSPDAPIALLQAKAFRALRGLGFGERDARRALEQTLHDCPQPSLDVVLRQCVQLLSERAWTKAS